MKQDDEFPDDTVVSGPFHVVEKPKENVGSAEENLSDSESEVHDLAEMPQLEIRAKLTVLRQEHRDLDSTIAALLENRRSDALQLQRLKKQKLALKDRISALEDALLPDIIA